uniref:Dihydrolipoamide acetyltransferase component of pyruvate dehydrogenase complex n=1 Tax=Paulinella longichromatophora TaxID=1708747 RepID=A0A2H4ZQK0_9EUKA|nr:dihydrolipoamide acetyltransferase [Paulinella longichromatophora]
MVTHEIFMPTLSSTMTEGKIVEWLKKPGDKISRGDSLLIVESDKADMDVEAFQEGFLATIIEPEGSTIPVGETIGLIVEREEDISQAQKKISQNSKKSTLTESQLNNQPSTNSIVIKTQPRNPLPSESKDRLVASPRAKKLAVQLGIELSNLKGTGINGRIQAEDVQKAAQQPFARQPLNITSNNLIAATSRIYNSGDISKASVVSNLNKSGETIPFNTLQNTVNRNMMASLSIPCFRVSYTITTDKLDSLYQEVKKKGITMTTLLVKAIGITLVGHPQINAFTSEIGITYPTNINIAVAVAMDDGGLLTPVLTDVDSKDIHTLSRSWMELVTRARSKQLKPEQYNTGTFTISNLGMFGVDAFDAILPPGTGAILAIAASSPRVLVDKNGSISIKRQMRVTLTSDHRVIYGAHAAAFLQDFARLIETKPENLMF